MDKTQLVAFLDYMIGFKIVGGTPDDPAETPNSPELRAFMVARLGDDTPRYGYYLPPSNRGTHQHAEWLPKAKALASFFREIAQGIDPQDLILPPPGIIDALRNCVNNWPSALNDDVQERTLEEARSTLVNYGIEL